MVKIINELGAGGRIGAAFGTGLGESLGALAQHKLDRMVKDKQAEETARVIKLFNPGISDQEANIIARAPEHYQKMVAERGVSTPNQQQQFGETPEGATGLQLGLSPKEKETKAAKSEAFRKDYESQVTSVEDQYNTIKDAKALLKDLKKDWKKLQPYVSTRKLYGDKPEDLKLDPRLQSLDLKLQHIANETAMKNIQKGKSKAGQIFFNASQREKPNIYKDYSVIEDYLDDLEKKIQPLEKESKIFKHILKKNKNLTPLDLMEQFQRAGGLQEEEVAQELQQEQPQQQQPQFTEGEIIEQGGYKFKVVNGQPIPIG